MDPSTLEAILMLRMNNKKGLWDEIIIQKVLIKEKQDRAAKRMHRDKMTPKTVLQKSPH